MYLMDNWKKVANSLESSYKQNDYGKVLYDAVIETQARRIAEIGCYQGYSTIHLAAALNDRNDDQAEMEVYDAWSWYKYRHCDKRFTIDNLKRAGLDHLCTFTQSFALDAPNYMVGSYDLIHVDIFNTGDTFEWATHLFSKYIPRGGLLIMEGGAEERDRVDWMVQFDKPKVNPLIERGFEGWDVAVLYHYPSMTIMERV